MEEIIDVNAGRIVRGEQDLAEVADEIVCQLVATAGGRPTKAETFGFADFSVATLAGAYSGV